MAVDCAPGLKERHLQKEEKLIRGNTKFLFRPSWYLNKFMKWPNRFSSNHWLHKKLKSSLSKNDILLVYHSLSYEKEIKKIKEKTGCRLIYQIEELYSDAKLHVSPKEMQEELSGLSRGDAFIFSSESLRQRCNFANNKPSCILYGAYSNHAQNTKHDHKKVELVYLGTLDPIKRGADNAIAALDFLDSSYVLHILSGEDPRRIMALAAKNTQRQASIIFEGPKYGQDLYDFLNSCDIGLSTQNACSSFNESSFPSKIITYLSCGLKIVSSKSVSVLNSSISDWLFFYDGEQPEEIATAIRRCSKTETQGNGETAINNLNDTFLENFSGLLENRGND